MIWIFLMVLSLVPLQKAKLIAIFEVEDNLLTAVDPLTGICMEARTDLLTRFKLCATGAGVPQNAPGCLTAFDKDGDGDIDMDDFGILQREFQ